MLWVPPLRGVVVVKLARWIPPMVVSVAVPRVWLVVVSVNVTSPVGNPPALVTSAVKVTCCGNWLGLIGSIVVVVAVSACAAPSDKSNVAQTSAAAPIMRRSFPPTLDAHTIFVPSVRANAERPNCQIVFTTTSPPLESLHHRAAHYFERAMSAAMQSKTVGNSVANFQVCCLAGTNLWRMNQTY